MNKRVLITGVAGFLGSFLAEELLSRGYTVTGIDNFFRGREQNLPNHRDFVFYNVDLTVETQRINTIIREENIEIVFHYAAINGTQYFYDVPYEVLNANVKMTQNILGSIEGTAVRKLVYASSSETYGEALQFPTSETQSILLNLDTVRSSYAASKAVGEFYVKLFAERYDIDYLILRIFNAYGPRMDTSQYGQVIPEFVRKVLQETEFTIIGDGNQTRSFCYVTDHTRLVVALAEVVSNEVVNVGSDQEIKIIDLAQIIHDMVGREFKPKFLPSRESDPQRRCPDISKLRKLVNTEPRISLRQGLKKVIGAYERR